MKSTARSRNGTNHDPRDMNTKKKDAAAADTSTSDYSQVTSVSRLPADGPPKGKTPQAPVVHVTEVRYDHERLLALFCFESPASPVGQRVARLVAALARRGVPVHLFTRHAYEFDAGATGLPQAGSPVGPNVTVHAVGESAGDLLVQVEEFTSRTANAFLQGFPFAAGDITLLGVEWSSAPVLSLLHGTKDLDTVVSLESFERQRSDMRWEVSRRIEEIECRALREAQTVLVNNDTTAELARKLVPDCASRLVGAHWVFPAEDLAGTLEDAGVVKARHQVGPLDPLVLYIGDFDDRHAPDVLMKAVPAVLKNNRQARFVFVGDGDLNWPLRVHARYLLLEHAVRLVGSLQGQELHDLIKAADVVVVPSRTDTEWWPVLAAWAAGRPVVATHEVGKQFMEHEQDGVLIYPNPNSCVWGIERILFDPKFTQKVVARARQKLDERFGWSGAAAQIESLMGVAQQAR